MPDPINNDTVLSEQSVPEPPASAESTPKPPMAALANPPNPLYQGGEMPAPLAPEPVQAPSEPAPVQPINLPNPPLQGGQSPPNPLYQGGIINLLQKAKEKIQFRKRAKLEKIMAVASSKASQAGSGEASRVGITNQEVKKLLRCSDSTATRYLSELVKQGRLRRVGPANNAFYEFLDPGSLQR